MQEKILDFIIEHPVVLIFLPFLGGIALFRHFQRTKRKLDHIDARGWLLFAFGFIIAVIVLAIWLVYY